MTFKQHDYDFRAIEARWQAFWEQERTFCAHTGDSRPKYYVLDMFPYPSGAGLHIGHPEGYTASDILARYKRAKGYNVLHPMGWDAFGLPAEQYAVKTGVHPSITTQQNIDNIRKQIKALGFSIDWEREIDTTDPGYYRWTQWIFLQLFAAGLAYVDERPVWWCPELGTVLANEEIVDGRSERGNHPVERRNLCQWVLRITAYADKLIEGLDGLDWPDSTKRQQRLWIGRSEGTQLSWPLVADKQQAVEVFTTCAHTLCGVTYLVLAPEHPLLQTLVAPSQKAHIDAYIQKTRSKSDLERTDLAKDKSGVFTGAYAQNPLSGEAVPIWVADYVLMSYGCGAVMAVPAHDERDWAFAQAYKLPIKTVVTLPEGGVLPYMGEGKLIASGAFDGLDVPAAKQAITQALAAQQLGKPTVQYKLRDWLFSRQRYWGEPFPILWVDAAAYQALTQEATALIVPKDPVSKRDAQGQLHYAVGLPETALPLLLPQVASFQPSQDAATPLSTAKEWVHIFLNLKTGATAQNPAGPEWVPAQRETNTMPQWAGSCWYHIRYLDPHNQEALVDQAAERYWGVPDFYIGGSEHAVLHLLYARFWHRFLYEQGVVSHPEPYQKLFHQGIILGEDGEKMSKSRGNVVNPDALIQRYGADALRLFEMFLGPLEATKPWSTQGIEGPFRFLKKAHREFTALPSKIQKALNDDGLAAILHESIAKVTEDIEHLRFNTAISQLMILQNHMSKASAWSYATALAFVRMLEPFAPHLACELATTALATPSPLNTLPWPVCDSQQFKQSQLTLVIQVNGRLRAQLEVPENLSQSDALALALPKITAYLQGLPPKKVIYLPGRILNVVV